MTASRVIGVAGLILAAVTLKFQFDSNQESERANNVAGEQRSGLRIDMQFVGQKTSDIVDHLKDLSSRIGMAKAHAADADGDARAYLKEPQARADVAALVAAVRKTAHTVEPSIALLTEHLVRIEEDYQSRARSFPTLPIEAMRVRGIVLSHRRQMAVLMAAIRESKPPPQYTQLVNRIESILNVPM